MIPCPSCGTMVADDTQLCPRCGNAITGSASQPQTISSSNNSVPTASHAATPSYQAPTRNLYRIFSLVLGVLLVGVSVVLIILLVRVSGSSAVTAGMGPGETLKTVDQPGKEMYNKLADNKLTEGDILTAYRTTMDIFPKAVKREKVEELAMAGRLFLELKDISSIEVVDESIDGDKATVSVRIQRSGKPPNTGPINDD
jgi:hypothetical protein